MGALVPPPGQPLPLQDHEFRPSAPANVVGFRTTQVDLPSPLYMQVDDVLDIKAQTIAGGGDTLTVSYRFLLPNGVIIPGQKVISLNAAIFSDNPISIAEGFLLSVSVSGGLSQRGQTFVQATIRRASAAASTQLQALFADYVTLHYSSGWPGGRVVMSTEGTGFVTQVSKANPGAGNNFSISGLNGGLIKVRCLSFILTTSATVANRVPRINILESGTTIAMCEPNQVVPASQTVQCTLSTSVPAASANVPDVVMALPNEMWVSSAGSISSSISNLQAGDTITSIEALFEEFVNFG